MDSKIGLAIQFTGVLLITALSWFLRRSLRNLASTYWAIGWASLSFALFCLSYAFLYFSIAKPLVYLYLLGEYVFGLMLIFGCYSLFADYRFNLKTYLAFGLFVLLAGLLAVSADDFNVIFNLHTVVFGTFFAVAFWALRSVEPKGFGWRVMRVALALLALDFYHYFVLFSFFNLGVQLPLPDGYLGFNPVIDLVLEVMLGFGMVIVLLEQVLDEMQKINAKLQSAHEKLKQIVHTDPLTNAFNRHAFYGYLRKKSEEKRKISGCVGFFDIDDLKPINDYYGHTAGDMAIRAVVGAIRALIRAEDLIYRWGGDEFFVVMVSMSAEMAQERMSDLERMLTNIWIEGVEKPVTIRVSFGFKDFTDVSDLEDAIKAADEEMYRRKKRRKRRRKLAADKFLLSNENIIVSREC
jgi:diguanylate cyclase (GGDEF)-like protein